VVIPIAALVGHFKATGVVRCATYGRMMDANMLARMGRLSPSTLRMWRKRPKLKPNSRRRWRADWEKECREVEAYVADQKAKGEWI
jgi:hypothetical protein